MKIGVLGIHGRLGNSLVQMGCEPINMDISHEENFKIGSLDYFDVIINCAAKTGVDACQHSHVQLDYFKQAVQVNTRAVEYIRKNFCGRLIHISTDYVFKCNHGPYKEDDKRDPVNDYGYTKLGGEILLETFPNVGLETVVVRTTGLFGSKAKTDFAQFVIDNIAQNNLLVMSHDLQGNHTYIPHLCEALLHIAEMQLPKKFMYLHVGSSDIMSRYEFAVMLANVFELPSVFLLFPGKNKEIQGWVAPRPTKGGLKVRLAQKLGVPIYSTLDGLKAYKEATIK